MPRVGSCFIAAGFVRDLRPEPELAAALPLGRGKTTVSRDPMIQAVTGELSAKVSPMTKTIELNARPEKCQQLFAHGGGRKFKSVADRGAGGYKRNQGKHAARSRGDSPRAIFNRVDD
jgi:hypothetical protein